MRLLYRLLSALLTEPSHTITRRRQRCFSCLDRGTQQYTLQSTPTAVTLTNVLRRLQPKKFNLDKDISQLTVQVKGIGLID
jgi:hypothetical protein